MSTMSKLGFAGLLVAIAGLSACGHARLVERNQSGGTFALEGDRNKAYEDARGQMAAHCGGPQNFQIVQEGEFVIGSDTSYGEDTSYGQNTATSKDGTRSSTAGGSSTSGGSSTRAATEWRVTYQCLGAMAPAPAPVAPAPAPAPGPGAPGY